MMTTDEIRASVQAMADRDAALMWYEKPITFDDIVHHVDRYLNCNGHTDRAEFITYECRHWRGVIWQDADAWNIARDWERYNMERLGEAS